MNNRSDNSSRKGSRSISVSEGGPSTGEKELMNSCTVELVNLAWTRRFRNVTENRF